MRTKLPGDLEALIERILGASFTVSTTLGHGFLEGVYRNALAEELSLLKCYVQMEKPFSILYRGKVMGTYYADMVVEDQIIVELRTDDALTRADSAQLLNYLKVSGLPVGLLLNFGTSKLEMKRIVSFTAH